MTRPEDALERARDAARRKRAAGGYSATPLPGLDDTIVSGRPSLDLLSRWAVIEVDAGNLYSTRRGGAPITVVKRGLLRLLRQYLVEVEARQTRFNIGVLATVFELERRVERLEAGGGEDQSE